MNGSEVLNPAKTEMMSSDTVETSFGVFKPVGHVMVGLPTQAMAVALVRVLHDAGWSRESLQRFAVEQAVNELEAMVDNASAIAGFGSEIKLLRRYLEMSRMGARWLLVKADGVDQATTVANHAREAGATLAVYYGSLIIEELL